MSTILIDQDNYKLVSYGNGSAYLLKRRDWGVALLGDDADKLRAEIEAFELAWRSASEASATLVERREPAEDSDPRRSEGSSRAALATYLWNTLEYGSAATLLETA